MKKKEVIETHDEREEETENSSSKHDVEDSKQQQQHYHHQDFQEYETPLNTPTTTTTTSSVSTMKQQRVIERRDSGEEETEHSIYPEHGFVEAAETGGLLTNDVLLQKIKDLENKVLKFEKKQQGHNNNNNGHDSKVSLGYTSVDGTTEVKEEEDIHMTNFPQDSYSFIILYGFREKPRKQPFVFLFGIYVWLIQATTLSLFSADRFLQGTQDNTLGIPANVDGIVRAAQYLAVIISVCFAGASLNDMIDGISIFPSYNGRLLLNYEDDDDDNKEEEAAGGTEIPKHKLALSCCLRFIQGGLGMFVSFLLIVQTDNVFDLVLNFTAVQFISELDNIAFDLTTSGFFGYALKQESESIQEMEIPIKLSRSRVIIKWVFVLVFIAFPMFYGVTYFAIQQKSDAYLCKTIRAEFGDEVSPILGYYNGCYHIDPEEKIDGRVTYKHNDTSNTGTFGYCADEEVWAFFRENDPCDYVARSEETSTYTIEETGRNLWFSKQGIPLDHFRLSCQDHNEAYCELLESDSADACDRLFLPPTVDNSPSDFSNTYQVLSDGSSSRLNLYGRPIFVDETVLNEDIVDKVSSVIFFTGRRWYLSDSERLHLPPDPSGIIEFFGQGFHPSQLRGESIHLASEAVEIDDGAGSPIGLGWLNVRSVEDPSKNGASVPYTDSTRPAAGIFLCAQCDEVENICHYEGKCQEDRTCQCEHGATGFLCDIKPLGDGICNPFFNTEEEGYDGGDCCANTCERDTSCGISTVTNAFESELQHLGDGFQLCQDPTSQPITIYIRDAICPQCPDSSIFCPPCNRPILKLVCGTSPMNERNYLASVELADFSNRSETVYIEPGAGCELSITHFESQFDSVRDWNITYEIYHGDKMALFDLMIGAGNSYDQTLVSFPVMLKCLQEILTPLLSGPQKLYDGSTEAKAAKWLNADLVASNSNSGHCEDTPKVIERFALAVVYISAGSSSLDDGRHCLWQGISCENERVDKLSLEGRSLNGTIAKEVALLEYLVELNVRDNELVGTIPTEIFSGSNLEWISIRSNALSGTLPSEIGNLGSVHYLNLEDNYVTGTLPTELGKMTGLLYFECDGNNFHGPIPSEVGHLSLLVEFDLDGNMLSSSIPTEIGNMVSLVEMDFKDNALTGPVPSQLGNLENLEFIELSNNALTGPLPSELGNLASLVVLDLSNNPNLIGRFPSQFCNNSHLEQLGISNTQLSWCSFDTCRDSVASDGKLLMPLTNQIETDHHDDEIQEFLNSTVQITLSAHAEIDLFNLVCCGGSVNDGEVVNTAGAWVNVYGDGGVMAASTCDDSNTTIRSTILVYSGDCDELACVMPQPSRSCRVTWQSQSDESYHLFISTQDVLLDDYYEVSLHISSTTR